MYKVLIVDDHKLFRAGVRMLLSDIGGVEVLGEASNGKEALDLIKMTPPNLVITDVMMPKMDGIEMTKKIRTIYPDINILVLSMITEEKHYNTMIDLGVKGFILKEAEKQEFERAISTIRSGDTFFSQELLLKIIKVRKDKSDIYFTKRELEVLEYICRGFSNSEIGEKLFISQRTVERHRANLLKKVGVSNSIKLVLYALRNNLVDVL